MGSFAKKVKGKLGVTGRKPGQMMFDHLIIVPSDFKEFWTYGTLKLHRVSMRGTEGTAASEGKSQMGIVVSAARKKYGPRVPMLGHRAKALGFSPDRYLSVVGNLRYYPAMLEDTIQTGDVVLIDHLVTESFREVTMPELVQNLVLDKNIMTQDRSKWKIYAVMDREIFAYVRDGKWHNYGEQIFVTPGTVGNAVKLGLQNLPENSVLDLDYYANTAWHYDRKIALAQVQLDHTGFGPIKKGDYNKGDWVLIVIATVASATKPHHAGKEVRQDCNCSGSCCGYC